MGLFTLLFGIFGGVLGSQLMHEYRPDLVEKIRGRAKDWLDQVKGTPGPKPGAHAGDTAPGPGEFQNTHTDEHR